MTLPALNDIDIISIEDVRALGSVEGPCISIFIPTSRHGAETLQGPVRLRKLVEQAERDLEVGGATAHERKSLLAPIRELIGDSQFWQHQGDGLAIFAAPGWFKRYRLPLEVAEAVNVNQSFRIRPLLPIVADGGSFLILALSENSVRLFEATRYSIGELDRGSIPGSIADALAHEEDRERQLQVRSGGGGTAEFHGHGVGDEIDKLALERYFRAVDKGLRERVGPSQQPLVLACVGYYQPIFRSVSTYPGLIDEVVEGNPDRRTPTELHDGAWPNVESVFSAERDRAIDQYREMAGTGKTATVIDEIVKFAQQGRVETLFIAHGATPQLASPDQTSGAVTESGERWPSDDDLVDTAARDTIGQGGTVHIVVEPVDPDAAVAAILRY